MKKARNKMIISILSATMILGAAYMFLPQKAEAAGYNFSNIQNYAFSVATDVNLGYRTKAVDTNNTGYYTSSIVGDVDYTWRLYLPDKSTQAMNFVRGVGERQTYGTLYTQYRSKGNAFRYKASNSSTTRRITLMGVFKTAS